MAPVIHAIVSASPPSEIAKRTELSKLSESKKQIIDATPNTPQGNSRFGLPNEIYRTADGTIFDLVGIPPDIEVPVFADADVAAGKDPAMARALEILSQQ